MFVKASLLFLVSGILVTFLTASSVKEIGKISFFAGLFLLVFIALLADTERERGYKNGQMDCMKGDVKYELKTETDSTYVKRGN